MSNPENKIPQPDIYPLTLPKHIEDTSDDKDSSSIDEENDKSLQNGRWNQDEHIRFVKGCLLYGNNWKKVYITFNLLKVKKYVKTRSSAQIRSHAQKYLIKLNKKYMNNNHYTDAYQLKNYKQSFNDSYDNANINLNNTNYDMETVEKMILSIFKNTNSEKGFQNINIDDININNESNGSPDQSDTFSPKKEKIFQLVKVSKEKKQEIQKMKEYMSQSNDNMYYNYPYQYPYYTNYYLNAQIDSFINSCLDSKAPEDLTKLLMYFNSNTVYQNQLYYQQQQQQANKENEIYNNLKNYVSQSYNSNNKAPVVDNTSTNEKVDTQQEKPLENNPKKIITNTNNYFVTFINEPHNGQKGTTQTQTEKDKASNLYPQYYYGNYYSDNPLLSQYINQSLYNQMYTQS